MSNEAKTLDQRIRKQALEALEARINEKMKPIISELAGCWSAPKTDIIDRDGMAVSVRDMLSAIAKSIVSAKANREQDDAVEAFMKKVDGLQDQLDELQQQIS